jgi:5-methylcytosine-specific restriction protein A
MRRQVDAARPNANQRGYNYRWQQASRRFLKEHPLCYYCQQEDPPRVTAATVVDHSIPHKGDRRLFWDESNWRASCKPHHDAKTAKEDGAFGNRGRGSQISTASTS